MLMDFCLCCSKVLPKQGHQLSSGCTVQKAKKAFKTGLECNEASQNMRMYNSSALASRHTHTVKCLVFRILDVFETLRGQNFEEELQDVIMIPICVILSQTSSLKDAILFLRNGSVVHIQCPSLSCVYF